MANHVLRRTGKIEVIATHGARRSAGRVTRVFAFCGRFGRIPATMKAMEFLIRILAFAIVVTNVPAQTLTVLHAFTNSPDGSAPDSGLVLSGGTLYGTAYHGGTNTGSGIVFSIGADGSGYRILHDFSSDTNGGWPQAGLVLSGDTLYGTTTRGGTNGTWGTVYSIKTNGSAFSVIHSFDTNYVQSPMSRLVLSGTRLYGTGAGVLQYSVGGVFAVNTDGSAYTNLHVFSKPPGNQLTNTDGGSPIGGLVMCGSTLYGAAVNGGTNNVGTIFSVDTNGGNFTVLHYFSNNPDGANPEDGLVAVGGTLYGTTSKGGTAGHGTVFSIGTNGSGYQVLRSFLTNGVDGSLPWASLVSSGNTLYGTAPLGGGPTNSGVAFSINADGTGYTVLRQFPSSADPTRLDGSQPTGDLIISKNILYGTTATGGANGHGTVFSLAFVPTISSFAPTGNNAVLQVTNAVGGENLVVLASSDLTLPLNQWTPVATNVATTGGSLAITATNGIDPTLPQQFFLLQVQ